MTQDTNLNINSDGTTADNAELIMLARKSQMLAAQLSEAEQIRAWRLAAQGCCGSGSAYESEEQAQASHAEHVHCRNEFCSSDIAVAGAQEVSAALADMTSAENLISPEAVSNTESESAAFGGTEQAYQSTQIAARPELAEAASKYAITPSRDAEWRQTAFDEFKNINLFAVPEALIYKKREELANTDAFLKNLMTHIADIEAVGKTDMYDLMVKEQAYHPADLYLQALRAKAAYLCHLYRQINPLDYAQLHAVLALLLGAVGKNSFVMPSLTFDYGINTKLGANVFINSNCTVLDIAEVTIGDNTMLGPNCSLYTVNHPTAADLRLSGQERGRAITIGKNVWLGGNVVVLGGVSIGDNTVVGAGSVVTRSLPANVVAAGNPARIVKYLDNN